LSELFVIFSQLFLNKKTPSKIGKQIDPKIMGAFFFLVVMLILASLKPIFDELFFDN